MVHVLVTNDDGPPGEGSPYITSFIKALKKHTDWDVTVAVPHTQRSWIGKAHLINESVYPTYIYVNDDSGDIDGPFDEKDEKRNGQEWVLLSGTPASCANIGIHHLNKEKGPIDLVISGPNYGRNSTALYIMSSGTVGAAMEGALCGVKSIGLSFAFETRVHDYKQIDIASQMSTKLVQYLYSHWDPKVELYSVNVPLYNKELEKAKIVYSTILQNQWGSAFQSWDYFDESASGTVTPRYAEDESTPAIPDNTKRKHFRWTPDFDSVNKSVEQAGPNNDGWALSQGYISVTPLIATFLSVPKQGEITLNKDLCISVKLSFDVDSYEYSLWSTALNKTDISWSDSWSSSTQNVFEYGDYDDLDFDKLQLNQGYHSCAYVYRKALIRKHYLNNCIRMYCAKHPQSILKKAFPESFNLECDYAEFLDDSLDEAYELRQELDADPNKMWIVKPSMSDRADGIRVFKNGVDGLQRVFDDLEGDDHEDGGLVGQLRHFIVQNYLENPLLLNGGRKFHIRTYVLAVGALKVYVYRDMLALFAAQKFNGESFDLHGHLTNTCFQGDIPENDIIYRFHDLDIADENKKSILSQISGIVSDLFAAAVADRINFQPLPNALEMYGLDFLVDDKFEVYVLEVNAYPDFKQTGENLKQIVAGFIDGVIQLGVKPLLNPNSCIEKSSSFDLVYNIDMYK